MEHGQVAKEHNQPNGEKKYEAVFSFDTSAATVCWKKEQHKTNVSNLNINLKHDICIPLDGVPTFNRKQTEKKNEA